MPVARYIVAGQNVDPKKTARAREFRREMTDAERVLWQRLRRNQLDGLHFRRQQVIGGFIVDFYCHSRGLVVEVDGGIHRQQQAYDTARDAAMQERGLRVLRLTNDEVNADVAAALKRIAEACRSEPNPLAPLPHGGRGECGEQQIGGWNGERSVRVG